MNMQKSSPIGEYSLIDSGEGEKLEWFGSLLVRRPSSVSIWKKRSPELWDKADVSYNPGFAKWSGKKNLEEGYEWRCNFVGCSLKLRLQYNGQVGVFPEHASYLNDLLSEDRNLKGQKILNLFAFTGLATLFFRDKGAEVTHVDLSKKVITWARENVEQQSGELADVRWVAEDALAYLDRLVRRKTQFDGIIIDPPSFSRVNKKAFWKVGDILAGIVKNCSKLLQENGKFLALTCHDPGISANMLANLMLDTFAEGHVMPVELTINEKDSPRVLPAGSCCIWKA